MQLRRWVPAPVFCMATYGGPARAAVTQDSFLLLNTADLVDLCTAVQADPLYTAASNFCHGFAVGAFRVLQEQEMARCGNTE